MHSSCIQKPVAGVEYPVDKEGQELEIIITKVLDDEPATAKVAIHACFEPVVTTTTTTEHTTTTGQSTTTPEHTTLSPSTTTFVPTTTTTMKVCDLIRGMDDPELVPPEYITVGYCLKLPCNYCCQVKITRSTVSPISTKILVLNHSCHKMFPTARYQTKC